MKVLDDISFSLAPGEVHALIGENGAGKSTLVKIIMGIYQRDAGQILLDGEEVFFQAPRDALQHGISIIQQELAPIMDIDVGRVSIRRARAAQAGAGSAQRGGPPP